MAKKIKLFSKLSKKEQNYINSLLDNSELKIINVNSNEDSKKGVVMASEDDEILIIFDIINEHIERDDEDDEDDEEDELGDDIELEEEEEKG
jgi:hypothetical protein